MKPGPKPGPSIDQNLWHSTRTVFLAGQCAYALLVAKLISFWSNDAQIMWRSIVPHSNGVVKKGSTMIDAFIPNVKNFMLIVPISFGVFCYCDFSTVVCLKIRSLYCFDCGRRIFCSGAVCANLGWFFGNCVRTGRPCSQTSRKFGARWPAAEETAMWIFDCRKSIAIMFWAGPTKNAIYFVWPACGKRDRQFLACKSDCLRSERDGKSTFALLCIMHGLILPVPLCYIKAELFNISVRVFNALMEQ